MKNTTDEVICTVKVDENGNEISSFVCNPDYVRPDTRSVWRKFVDWVSGARVYVGRRDLNNGPDTNGENKPKTATEIGIRLEW